MNALAKLASKVLATPVVAAPVRGLALSAGELSSILEDRISSYYTESDGASVDEIGNVISIGDGSTCPQPAPPPFAAPAVPYIAAAPLAAPCAAPLAWRRSHSSVSAGGLRCLLTLPLPLPQLRACTA